VSEVGVVLAAIDHALPRLRRWAADERVSVGWRHWPARGRIVKQPLGVVGVLSPWNYPVQLSLMPVVGALARDRAWLDEMIAKTRSGGIAINETVLHVAVEALPFGGVGASGYGAYHGRAGFDAFTHRRSVFVQSRYSGTRLMRPPYGAMADRVLRLIAR
jgi:acyl-CoA reductase-like NAD-dependent aldehyde dehydrogenase